MIIFISCAVIIYWINFNSLCNTWNNIFTVNSSLVFYILLDTCNDKNKPSCVNKVYNDKSSISEIQAEK